MGNAGAMAGVKASAFRQDINALRALSVVAVAGYHLQIPGFAGGFAGVDAFLVITGYLMTGKVLADLERGRFSFRAFAVMRMRRICPALVAVTFACVAAGWVFTLPHEYLKHLLQALSALAFVSNFAFNNDNGYFAMAAQTKPLLHTWSLSVEGQFYTWMPLAALLIWRRSGSKLNTVMIAFLVAAGASLAWCLWKSQTGTMDSAFFSLRARAWEPLVGGLIAIAELRGLDMSRVQTRAVAVAGWLLVAACTVYPMPKAQWPNALTMLPILGAAMIVAARQWSAEGGVVGLSPIQRMGDWSYSIYLWHWPVWVFALGWLSLRGYSVGAEQKALIAAVSLALAVVSYYLIEQPFRTRREFWTPRRLEKSAGIAFASLAVFVGLAFLDQGIPGRLPRYLRPAELARRTDTPRDECFRNANSVKKAAGTYCSFGSEESADKPSVILWGDSFANQYLEPITSAALAYGLHGLIATQSACRAFVDDEERNAGDQRPCREFNRDTLAFVLGHTEPSIVVLGSNWSNAAEVSALVDRLISADKTVILIMPLLNIGFDLPQRWIEKQVRAGGAIAEWKVKANPALTMGELRNGFAQILAEHQGDPRLITVDPQSVICPDGYCYLVRDGQANFRDTAHISNVNAMQYGGLFNAAFAAALRSENAPVRQSDASQGLR